MKIERIVKAKDKINGVCISLRHACLLVLNTVSLFPLSKGPCHGQTLTRPTVKSMHGNVEMFANCGV